MDNGQKRLTLGRAFHPSFQKHMKQSAAQDALKTQMRSTIMESSPVKMTPLPMNLGVWLDHPVQKASPAAELSNRFLESL